MGKARKGKNVKASRKNYRRPEEDFSKVPHTLVFNRGVIGRTATKLMRDVKRVFEPFTARNLKTTRKNLLKDFVSIAGPMGINYFLAFSKTDIGNNLRIMRLSRGPTMTFKINEFTLTNDIAATQKKQSMYADQFLSPPLLVLNNFTGNKLHLKLMATMFQNMFPSIDVNKVNINNIRRCVLVNYTDSTKQIDFRHYSIKAVPVGLSRSMKKLIKPKVPSLQHYKDVSDYFLNAAYLSESEAELDGEHNEVTLPQKLASRGNEAKQKSAVRLVEIGPRISLELIKIEEGLSEGEVLYHSHVTKSNEEITKMREGLRTKRKVKVRRKMTQDENVKRKQQKKEEHRNKSLKGMEHKQGAEAAEEDEDDDVEYYRQEVGEEPDPDLFLKKPKSSRRPMKRKADQQFKGKPFKKKKMDHEMSENKQNFNMKFSKGFQGKGKVFRKSSALERRERNPTGKRVGSKSYKGNDRQKGSFRKKR